MAKAPAEDMRVAPSHFLLRRVSGFRRNWHFGWLEAGILAIVVLALGMRLWELGGRTVHYDEAIHLHYSWRLLNSDGLAGGFPWIFGKDFIHSPWMHGPFQIEFTAFIFRLFGDSDFTARLGYVLFGSALVALPYFLRDYLGRAGTMLTAVMLALSPALIYFSRFGRNDIIMVFWALALLVLMWRYMNEGKNRYLYLAALVLAFMFGTKETAYIVVAIFGGIAFLLALPNLVPWTLGRDRLSQMDGPAGIFLLFFTLTLPQWVAFSSILLNKLGLNLATSDGGTGLVGAPDWSAPFVSLPVYDSPVWFHFLSAGVLVGILLWLASKITRSRKFGQQLGDAVASPRAIWVGVPISAVAAFSIAVFQPIDAVWSVGGAPILDIVLAGAIAGAGIGGLFATRHPWRTGIFLLIIPAQLALVYAFFLTNVVDVESIVNGLLPAGISVDSPANGVPRNYLVAAGLLLASINISTYFGVRWLGGRWILMAGMFYIVWLTIYTTVFTNLAGAFSGIWQGMGYWIAQQDVARGNQPWYYYFVGLSIYEMLPVAFGIVAAVYFVKKADILGLVLTIWAIGTFVFYTLASEKMPWIIVNISVPFILLSAKFLGEMVERIRWRHVLRRGQVILLALPAGTAAAVVYLLYVYTDPGGGFSAPHWALLFAAALLAIATAYLIRQSPRRNGSAMLALSFAGLLLGFGVVTAVRVTYTFDDSNQEFLVYAQGSKDLKTTFQSIDEQLLSQQPDGEVVAVDYDLWYPFNWYVRDAQRSGALSFNCYKGDDETDYNSSCNPADEDTNSKALLLSGPHGGRDTEALSAYEREGPLRNLLWFYELAYRRPGENRQEEGSLWGLKGIPNKEQITKDFGYFKSVATSRQSWFDTLDYMLFRNLDGDWYNSEFYAFSSP